MKQIIKSIGAVIVTALFTSCDTPEGARALQGMMPTFTVYGTGMGRKTYKVPVTALMSKRLNFQDAVLKGDIDAAQRYGSPSYVNIPIKGYPPVYYASIRGDSNMVELLARLGASFQYRVGGQSLAYIASSYGHFNTSKILVSMGAGNNSDIARGSSLYAANEARRRRDAKIATGLAVAFVQAMMSGNSQNSSSDDQREYEERERGLNYEFQKANDQSYQELHGNPP